jgi:hypothetical protein
MMTTTATLSSTHHAMLTQGSGLSEAVIAARGYRTSTGYSELKSLGIALPRSADAHGLLLPLHTVEGKPGAWFDVKADRTVPLTIYRPDTPLVTDDGSILKYLYPKGVGMRIDCSPLCQPSLDDPAVPLWITEGQRKGDALVTHDACALALLGVWNFRGTNAKGGKTMLADWQHVTLQGRDVRVVYDSDVMEKAGVARALDDLVTFLVNKGARVHVAYLPSIGGAKVGVDDYLLQHSLTDLEGLLAAPGRKYAKTQAHGRNGKDMPAEDLQDTRPCIRIGPDITRMVDEGQAALLALPNGPVLFQRARRLSIIARGVKPPRWLHRPADAPVIVEAPAAYLEELATKAARWEKFDKRAKKGKEWVEVTPPARFVKTLQARPSWPFPLLEGIIHSPTLRPDGSILDTPGYDADTGLFFDSNGTTFPAIPQRPTLDEARSAIGRLQEVVQDFPFAEPCHFSAWLSAVLSVVCRYAILGCVPMHGITATAPGSGKSLLSDTIALIGTGHTAARWSQVTEEEEERKRLFTLALSGDQLIVIDNITAPLGSGALANALTATSLTERILGTFEEKVAPMTAVFLCTGNNVQYVNDVARRVVPIALDPKMERPEERTGFLHPNLPAWIQSERPRLTIAALTIAKAYFTAGCPSQGLTPFGSFEPWSDLIRQALVWAGEADPNEGRKDIAAESDPDVEAFRQLLACWHACYAREQFGVTLKRAQQDALHLGAKGDEPANAYDDLREALGALDPKYDGKSLRSDPIRYALRKWQGRVLDGMRLVKAGEDHRATRWRVQTL